MQLSPVALDFFAAVQTQLPASGQPADATPFADVLADTEDEDNSEAGTDAAPDQSPLPVAPAPQPGTPSAALPWRFDIPQSLQPLPTPGDGGESAEAPAGDSEPPLHASEGTVNQSPSYASLAPVLSFVPVSHAQGLPQSPVSKKGEGKESRTAAGPLESQEPAASMLIEGGIDGTPLPEVTEPAAAPVSANSAPTDKNGGAVVNKQTPPAEPEQAVAPDRTASAAPPPPLSDMPAAAPELARSQKKNPELHLAAADDEVDANEHVLFAAPQSAFITTHISAVMSPTPAGDSSPAAGVAPADTAASVMPPVNVGQQQLSRNSGPVRSGKSSQGQSEPLLSSLGQPAASQQPEPLNERRTPEQATTAQPAQVAAPAPEPRVNAPHAWRVHDASDQPRWSAESAPAPGTEARPTGPAAAAMENPAEHVAPRREQRSLTADAPEQPHAPHVAFSGKIEQAVAHHATSRTESSLAPERPQQPEAPTPVRLPQEPPEAPRTPVRSLTISIEPTAGTERTDIHFVHRNGVVDMAVRATNPETARILRNDLPELVRNLENQGFQSDLDPGEQHPDGRSRRQYERTDDDD